MSLPNPRFEASYQRLFGHDVALGADADRFFARFYEHFLARDDIAELFEGVDMARQTQMLKKSLMHVVAYPMIDTPSAELRRLAELHGKLGLPRGSFDHWLACLLETVREIDPECDEATEPRLVLGRHPRDDLHAPAPGKNLRRCYV